MFPRSGWSSCFLAIGLLACVLPAAAAPLPNQPAKVDKYFLDDTDFILSVNVKQILDSALFKQDYRKQAQELLKSAVVETWLKDTGFDPLRDVDRIVLVQGRSSHRTEIIASGGSSENWPFIIVQGRFTPPKLHAKAEQIAKDTEFLKIHKVGTGKIYEISNASEGAYGAFGHLTQFVAVLDNSTVVASAIKEQVVEALDKAAGKRTTRLQHRETEKLLKGMDLKQSVALAATSDTIWSLGFSATAVNGAAVTKVEYTTLGDVGIQSIQGGITVDDSIKARAVVLAKDGDHAKKVAKSIDDGLTEARAAIQRVAAMQKELAPLVEALKKVKASTKDDAVALEAAIAADVLPALLKALTFAYSEQRAAPAPPKAVPAPPKP